VIGAALGKVVTAVVDDLIMPIVAVVTPAGNWQTSTVDLGPFHFKVGDLASALINFIIIGFVVWRISKAFIKPEKTPATKQCPFCRMSIDTAATRCPHCTSQLATVAAA
jgi:large conductance mechanosensitive channel